MRASYNEIASDADVLVAAMNYNNVATKIWKLPII